MKIKDKLIAAIFVSFFVSVGYMIGVSKTEVDCVEENNNVKFVEILNEQQPDDTIYVTPTGKRYHFSSACAGKNAIKSTTKEQKNKTTPCKKCVAQ